MQENWCLNFIIIFFSFWSLCFASALEMYWPVIQDEVGQNVNWLSLSSLGVIGRWQRFSARVCCWLICNSILKQIRDLFWVQHLGH